MKNFNLILVAILGIVLMTACGSQKQISQTKSSTSNAFGEEITMPCVGSSMDDDEYFRGLGMGQDVNPQNARTSAITAAQSMIKQRLGGFIQGLSTDYTRTMAGSTGEKTQRAMEGEMNKVVERMINDAKKTCEKMTNDGNRNIFNSFIALEIPKGEMLNKIENAISENEELEIEFNRDQFRKFAEDKMQKMKEAQKAKQGY